MDVPIIRTAASLSPFIFKHYKHRCLCQTWENMSQIMRNDDASLVSTQPKPRSPEVRKRVKLFCQKNSNEHFMTHSDFE